MFRPGCASCSANEPICNLGLKAVRETIDEITDVADVVNEGIGLIFAAFEIHERYKFSFYDSLIEIFSLSLLSSRIGVIDLFIIISH